MAINNLKEEIEKLRKVKGEIRGVSLKGDGEFVLKEVGEKGLKKLEETMAKLGFPIKYREIKPMSFYPLSLDAINLVTITKLFNFDEKKLQELGRFLAKASLLLRLFMRYFASIETIAKKAPEMWKKSYTIGDLKFVKFDKEKKHMIIRLGNFQVHPLYCPVFRGYLSCVVHMVINSEITCEETKCMFRGDPYHEFSLKWD